MHPSLRAAVVALAAAGAGAGLAACGDDADPVAAERAEQARAAVADADLAPEVGELIAAAAGATGATFQVTYQGEQGATVVVSQRPPDRRVDVVDADGSVLESHVVRGATAWRCERDGPGLACQRDRSGVRGPGTFTDEALEQLVAALDEAAGAYDLAVEAREVAGVEASCLLTRLRPGHEAPSRGAVGTLCVSAEGAQLLVDTAGERLEAIAYTTSVPTSTFDVG